MTKLICYLENERKGGWANIQMNNGDICWVEVTQNSAVVKQRRGLFGGKLYEESDGEAASSTAQQLSGRHPNKTPSSMRHPVLKSFVNTVLHCGSLAEVEEELNTPHQ